MIGLSAICRLSGVFREGAKICTGTSALIQGAIVGGVVRRPVAPGDAGSQLLENAIEALRAMPPGLVAWWGWFIPLLRSFKTRRAMPAFVVERGAASPGMPVHGGMSWC